MKEERMLGMRTGKRKREVIMIERRRTEKERDGKMKKMRRILFIYNRCSLSNVFFTSYYYFMGYSSRATEPMKCKES
jgi:hypothetical protein